MTEEIIKSITEAEEKATDMKTAAYARAAEIAAQAEIRAAEIATQGGRSGRAEKISLRAGRKESGSGGVCRPPARKYRAPRK